MKKIILIAMAFILTFLSCKNETNKVTESNKNEPPEITKVVGIARIEPENGLLNIYANTEGTVINIPYKENDVVQKETVLIELDKKEEVAQWNLEQSKMNNYYTSLNTANEELKSIHLDLLKAKEHESLHTKLFLAKAITLQTLNDSKAKVEKLTTDYNKQLAVIEQVKSERTLIDAHVNYRKILLSKKSITASQNGKILEWNIKPGDYITVGQKLGKFAPKGGLLAVTEVDELFANKVELGMKADVVSQLDGQKIGEGKVVFIADFLKKKSLFADENVEEDRRVRTVKILLKPTSKAIINARVDCIIKLK